MKIVHLAKFYHPYKGGMETVVKSLCSGFSKQHQVEVICANSENKEVQETVDNVKVKRLANWGTFASQPLVPSILKGLNSVLEADIVHVHVPNPLVEFSSLLRLPKTVKIVATHHSDIVKQKILGSLYMPLLQRFYQRVDKIIVPTENHIWSSRILPKFKDKIEVVPFGLDLDQYPSLDSLQEKIGEKKLEYKDYFIFIGRLVSYKGVEFLIRAMAKVKANLLICGVGPLETNLKQLAMIEGVHEKVTFLGEVSSWQDLGALIAGSRGLVLPSISNAENFGMVQLEAMLYKVPVMATNLNSGASTIVKNFETGFLVDPENPEQLSKAMNEILLNGENTAAMGDFGHQRLLDFYTYETMIQNHENIYSRLIKDS